MGGGGGGGGGGGENRRMGTWEERGQELSEREGKGGRKRDS